MMNMKQKLPINKDVLVWARTLFLLQNKGWQ